MAVFKMSGQGETLIQVRTGEVFSLEFDTSPGTGYVWMLDAPLDQKMLTIIETVNEPPRSGLIGASEKEIWKCRALLAGQTDIALKYTRPWEKDTLPLKKHVFRIRSK